MYQLSPHCREHSAASSALLAVCSRQLDTDPMVTSRVLLYPSLRKEYSSSTRILWRQAQVLLCPSLRRESTAHYYLRFKVKLSGFPGCLLAKVNECTTESVALLLAQFFANTCAWWSVMVWLLLLLEHVRTRLESAMTSIFDIHFCLVGMKPPWLYDSPNSIINGWYAHVKPPRLYDSPNRSINSWYTRLKPNLTVQFTQQFH